MKQEELLEWLRCRFCNEETPCGGCVRLKQGCQERQAYQQIKELIQKSEVTEEWIDNFVEEKAIELCNYLYYETFKLKHVKDFLCLFIKELKV